MNCEVEEMREVMICRLLAGVIVAAFLGGCASPTSEDDFGNSVRRMIEAQKYIPPGQRESSLPVLDGSKAETTVGQYRKDVGNPERIQLDMKKGYMPIGKK